jgi:hypothetical protein
MAKESSPQDRAHALLSTAGSSTIHNPLINATDTSASHLPRLPPRPFCGQYEIYAWQRSCKEVQRPAAVGENRLETERRNR